MRLKRTLVVLAIAGSTALTGGTLTGCAGENTDITRGETDCDGGNNNTHDENCGQTGTPSPAENT